jgi:hypothetical protein
MGFDVEAAAAPAIAPGRMTRLAAAACAIALVGIATTAVAQSTGITLKVTNATSTPVPVPVPVQITLGSSSNPASQYGIRNINPLPASWGHAIRPPPRRPPRRFSSCPATVRP